MITIELTNASNGIIKRVIDKNSNLQIDSVYELISESVEDFDVIENFDKIRKFFIDLSRDLALDLGSDKSADKLQIDVDWGEQYCPTLEEVEERIKLVKQELRSLQDYKKTI